MLCTYVLKNFTEQLNLLNVDDNGITPMVNFSGTTTYILFKINTHGPVQFMPWMQYCKEIYLDYPSGSPAHMQGYILIKHHFMQDQ